MSDQQEIYVEMSQPSVEARRESRVQTIEGKVTMEAADELAALAPSEQTQQEVVL